MKGNLINVRNNLNNDKVEIVVDKIYSNDGFGNKHYDTKLLENLRRNGLDNKLKVQAKKKKKRKWWSIIGMALLGIA